MKNIKMREEVYIETAYQFLQAGYDTIHISKKEFRQQIENATSEYEVARILKEKRGTKRFDGWLELQSIFKEILEILRHAKEATSHFQRSNKVFSIQIETEKYLIHIERSWRDRYDIVQVAVKTDSDRATA